MSWTVEYLRGLKDAYACFACEDPMDHIADLIKTEECRLAAHREEQRRAREALRPKKVAL
jgi:hypothetical protein